MAVGRSGYYAWLNRKTSASQTRREQLELKIAAIYKKSRKHYGSPRIHQELKSSGECIGKNLVAKIMRNKGLRALSKRKFRQTTDSKHAFPIADNILDRNFSPEAPNRAWVGDISVP